MADVLELFERDGFVKVCAPMVRYSKLPFRSLVRKYECDLCFTPMILADSFVKSSKSRQVEFSTNKEDTPLVVQFASNNAVEFASAAEMVSPYSHGVDLNCGCPQRWAMQEGYGADLLTKPQLVKDMVLQVRNRIPKPFTVSVKIRILDNLRQTIDLCQSLEAAGTSFLTVHARTPQQKHQPVNIDAFREIRDSVRLPLIANGDVKTLRGAEELHNVTKYQGIMAARGMLSNPAMFAGFSCTPLKCVQNWVDIALEAKVPFKCFHHHLVFMLEKVLPKSHRNIINCLKSTDAALEFLSKHYNISSDKGTLDWLEEGICDDENGEGSYFTEKVTKQNNMDDNLEGSFDIFNI